MSDEFFRTRMGQRFYEATLPKIADQLERLNANIEALVEELRRRSPLDDQAAQSARARDSEKNEKKGREPR